MNQPFCLKPAPELPRSTSAGLMAAVTKDKYVVEAARAATMAVHSAMGLSLASSREAARLLRAAEGLCRAAVAVLASEPKAHTNEPTARQPRRRRPRGKRVDAQGKMDMDVSTAAEEENTIGGNTCSAGGGHAMDGGTATTEKKRKAESSEPPGDEAQETEAEEQERLDRVFEEMAARTARRGNPLVAAALPKKGASDRDPAGVLPGMSGHVVVGRLAGKAPQPLLPAPLV